MKNRIVLRYFPNAFPIKVRHFGLCGVALDLGKIRNRVAVILLVNIRAEAAERKAVASQNIDYVVKHGFGPFSSDVRFNVDTDHIKDGKFGFTFVAKYDYKDTKLDELIKKITNGKGTDIKSNHVDNWTNVGVVVKTVNGQTYIAVSVAIDVS